MTRLLSANFLRLWKNQSFWASVGVSLAMGLFMAADSWRSAQQSGGAWDSTADAELFKYAAFIGILAAALIPLFFGTEYSDGTIRCKLIVGHPRAAIYFANLITGFAACMLCCAAYVLGCAGLGIPLLGWSDRPASLLLAALAGSLLMAAAYCAVFTFVTMNIRRKSIAVVVCLLAVFAGLIGALVIHSRLDAPEFISSYQLGADGQLVLPPPQPNPNYLTGGKRAFYQFLYDLLPTGQSIQYCSLLLPSPLRLMGLAAAVTALFSAAGAALFERKDLT